MGFIAFWHEPNFTLTVEVFGQMIQNYRKYRVLTLAAV